MKIFTYYNILHYPPSHSIKNLPSALKEIISDRLSAPEFNVVKNFLHLECEDNNLIKEFIDKNNITDTFRKQDFKTTFGEWGTLVTGYADE